MSTSIAQSDRVVRQLNVLHANIAEVEREADQHLFQHHQDIMAAVAPYSLNPIWELEQFSPLLPLDLSSEYALYCGERTQCYRDLVVLCRLELAADPDLEVPEFDEDYGYEHRYDCSCGVCR